MKANGWRRTLLGLTAAAAAWDRAEPAPPVPIVLAEPPPLAEQYGGVVLLQVRAHTGVAAPRDGAAGFAMSPDADAAAVDRLNAALKTARAGAPAPTFSRPAAALRAERMAAEPAAGRTLPDLALFYDIRVSDYPAACALLDALRANPLVEHAYLRTRPMPPPTGDWALRLSGSGYRLLEVPRFLGKP